MLAKALRRWIGSVRLAMTLLTVVIGLLVALLDQVGGLRASGPLYGFLSALAGLMAAFVYKDTERPSGYTPARRPWGHSFEEGAP